MVVASPLEDVEASSLSKDSEFDQDPKTVWKKSKRLLTFATASNHRANVDVLVEAEAEAYPDTTCSANILGSIETCPERRQ